MSTTGKMTPSQRLMVLGYVRQVVAAVRQVPPPHDATVGPGQPDCTEPLRWDLLQDLNMRAAHIILEDPPLLERPAASLEWFVLRDGAIIGRFLHNDEAKARELARGMPYTYCLRTASQSYEDHPIIAELGLGGSPADDPEDAANPEDPAGEAGAPRARLAALPVERL
jgi:hypothetical protein